MSSIWIDLIVKIKYQDLVAIYRSTLCESMVFYNHLKHYVRVSDYFIDFEKM